MVKYDNAEQLWRLEQLEQLGQLEQLWRLEQLGQLWRLEQLEQLGQLGQLGLELKLKHLFENKHEHGFVQGLELDMYIQFEQQELRVCECNLKDSLI